MASASASSKLLIVSSTDCRTSWFKLHKSCTNRIFFRKSDLRGASTIKNHSWCKILLLGVVQWVIKNSFSEWHISLFQRKTENQRGFRGVFVRLKRTDRKSKFCKSLCGKHFYGNQNHRLSRWYAPRLQGDNAGSPTRALNWFAKRNDFSGYRSSGIFYAFVFLLPVNGSIYSVKAIRRRISNFRFLPVGI